MNKKKAYKKGAADALEAVADFEKKQGAATKHVADEVKKVGKKVDKVGEKIGEMKDYITDREKATLYKLNTPVDIADLDGNEKRVLLAVLYQLSADEEELTEAQQGYVRAVQQYLKLYNPQTEIDLEAVENIEDISAQKAILQAVLEFFYLGAHPGSFTEDQMEVLDYFQVNRKTRREISDHIKAIVEAVGVQGLAEKYGFVPGQAETGFLSYNDNGDIPEQVAETFVSFFDKRTARGFGSYDKPPYYLDTTHYIVFWHDHNEDDPEPWLYRMDKRTGEVAPLPPIDANPWELQYHIQGDMLYLIRSNSYGWDYVKSLHPIAVDVDKLTCRTLPLEFTRITASNNKFPYFHLSGDSTHLVVYAFDLYATAREKNPLSKLYVIDLTQDRVFLVEPDMLVRDAFWWDNSLMLLGKQGEDISIFRYDMATKTATNIFDGKFASASRSLWWSSGVASSVDRYDETRIIKRMERIDGTYYFLVETIKNYGEIRFQLYTPKLMESYDHTSFGTLSEIGWMGEWPGCYFRDGRIFILGQDLWQYDYAKKESARIEIGRADPYLLLGDWLFKRKDKVWYKTNISKGTDALQWEVLVLPEEQKG